MQPSSEVAGQELVQRGMALFKAGAYTDAGAALEQAFGAFIRAERLVHAARVAIRLRQLYTTLDEPAAARGWEQRASRVLERIGPCVERGYLALSVTGCEVRDPCDLAAKAELALGLARQFGDHELELRALADKGLALIGLGQVDDGLALLDEVMVAVAAGEIANPEIRGTTICAMLAACERTGDAARAAYWSQKVENDRYLNEIPIVGTHCLMAQGAVESLLGRWSRAEERLRAAMQAGMTTAYHT
ncbi:MAG TPA: hypothetical protein VK009_25130, partial [Chloroflexota bacterium]|nr:hypothetical protein [Chloroflexota bacterium]